MTIALVTGANRGLGPAIARALAQGGACILLAGRDRTNADEAAAMLRDDGLDVQAIQLDVTSTDSIAAARWYASSTCRAPWDRSMIRATRTRRITS